jgi:transcriptional regulator with XRE-family HTH domain
VFDRSTIARPAAIARPSRPSHRPAIAMNTHSAAVTAGQGDTSASTGAKKKPVPIYQDDPARSQIRTTRSHRGTGAPSDVEVMCPPFSLLPPRCAVGVSAAITSEVVVLARVLVQTEAVTKLHAPPATFGALLRSRRMRRRLSQLDLALAAGVSARHVSFIETGRSTPSRAMVLRLAAALDVPQREQNRLLVAAGLAPAYTERPWDAPDMAAVRAGVQTVLDAYEPYPCVVLDRGWWILQANPGAGVLLDGVAPHLLERPNALRIALHPDGLAPRIGNLAQWRTHLIERLRREAGSADSDELTALLAEIESYPGGFEDAPSLGGVAVPLELETTAGRRLRFLSMVTTFGTALDLTAAELSIEAFLPADEDTAAALR